MKKIFVALLLTLQIVTTIYSQHSVEEFYVHDEENTFYLLMPVSEIHRILGNTGEIIIYENPDSSYFERIVLRYSEIEFHYYNFFDDPEILMIAFGGSYQIGSMNLIGRNKDEVLKEYGNPRSIETQDEYIYLRYQFRLSWVEYIVLQLRFNTLDICDGAILIHNMF